MSVALKLVPQSQFSEQIDVDIDTAGRELHSLHHGLSNLSPWQPCIVRYVVERFSQKGELVADLFCGAGASGLEAALLGRSFTGSTPEPALAALADARLNPGDLGDVALRMQLVNLKRPVDVRSFKRPFPLFFDVDTFCELVNLKAALRPAQSNVDAFIMLLVAGILHGHTVAHLSGYTSPNVALSADQQAELNRKRGEVPSYRALAPRVLRKAAMMLRDGVPSILGGDAAISACVADPRSLNHIGTGKVDLALVAPEQPGAIEHGIQSWLRCWWLTGSPFSKAGIGLQGAAWQDYANEVLTETARVVRRGGRAVVRVATGRAGSRLVNYKEELSAVLAEGLNGFWAVEGTIVENHVKSSGLAKGASVKGRDTAGELIVLRRR